MTQQDYTAPVWPMKVSRKERFQQVFSVLMADGVTPDTTLSTFLFMGDLIDQAGVVVNVALCSRPDAHSVLVELTTAQMNALRAGKYRLEVYGLSNLEREDLVTILMTVE